MEITVKEKKKYTKITLKGRLDSFNSPLLNEKFESLHKDKKYRFFIDLSSVEFINSTTLGLLIETMKKNNENSGFLYLIGCSEKVKKILQITKLDKIFPVFDSLDSASRSLNLKVHPE